VSPDSRSRTSRDRSDLRPGTVGGRASGFTLIEVMVVLVIVALISATLLFAFQSVLDIRLRLAQFLDGTDTPNLVAGWFRDTVDGLVPDIKDGAGSFTGAPRRLTGLSLAPLNGLAGVPTRITWEVAFDASTGRTDLRYQGAEQPEMTIASWPDDRGGFRYCGPDLVCYDHWPPPSGIASEVPFLIRLDAVRGTDAWAILAAPRNGHNPLPKPQNQTATR
jgi:prepilin-type N-terminal cleavage/methylation domain-containing protein